MSQIDIGTKLICALRSYSALMCDCRTVGTGGQAGVVITPRTPPDFIRSVSPAQGGRFLNHTTKGQLNSE